MRHGWAWTDDESPLEITNLAWDDEDDEEDWEDDLDWEDEDEVLDEDLDSQQMDDSETRDEEDEEADLASRRPRRSDWN